jgi:hypothetical protein
LKCYNSAEYVSKYLKFKIKIIYIKYSILCKQINTICGYNDVKTMPNVCAGRPDGRCPKNSHDDSVKWSTADLFLCPDCLEYRFPTSVSDNACNNATASVERSEIL